MADRFISTEAFLNTYNSILAAYGVSYREVGATSYYAFENQDGEWYIMKEAILGAITTTTYCKGSTDLATNWSNRATLSYDTFSNTF